MNMNDQFDLNKINNNIQGMKAMAIELEGEMEHFPAVSRNIKRILASLKMLEINISDLVEYDI